jgi:hypothetical protein
MENFENRPSEAMGGYCSQVVEMIKNGNLEPNEDPIEKVVAALSNTELVLMVLDALENDENVSDFFIESLPVSEKSNGEIPIRTIVGQVACEMIYNEVSPDPQVWEHYRHMYTDDAD